MTTPHLLQYSLKQSLKERWSVTVNNHIRKHLWNWWVKGSQDGTWVMLKSGTVKHLKNVDVDSSLNYKGVQRVLMLSNNAEDLSQFVCWVTEQPINPVVMALMNSTTTGEMVKLVWEHGVETSKTNGNVLHLKSPRHPC